MSYRFYELNNELAFIKLDASAIPFSLNQKLIILETEIIKEFLNKQEGRIGIKSLGNEIRYSKVIKEVFNNREDNNYFLIKMTENRRSFIKLFIDSILENKKKTLFFLILEDNFGSMSNLVDNSFIRIDELREELLNFFSLFSPKFDMPQIVIIELYELKGYQISKFDKYSKLEKYE